MADEKLIALEKWISAENVAKYRDRLAEYSFGALHVQYQGLLDRELAKVAARKSR